RRAVEEHRGSSRAQAVDAQPVVRALQPHRAGTDPLRVDPEHLREKPGLLLLDDHLDGARVRVVGPGRRRIVHGHVGGDAAVVGEAVERRVTRRAGRDARGPERDLAGARDRGAVGRGLLQALLVAPVAHVHRERGGAEQHGEREGHQRHDLATLSMAGTSLVHRAHRPLRSPSGRRQRVRICGVITKTTSVCEVRYRVERNSLPRIGRSPSSGILSTLRCSIRRSKPPITMDSPALVTTSVASRLTLSAGTVKPLMFTPSWKSRSETSGAITVSTLPSPRMLGVTTSLTPKSLYMIAICCGPAATGIGIWPPTRKFASRPGSVTRSGEERIRAWLFCSSRFSVGASVMVRKNEPSVRARPSVPGPGEWPPNPVNGLSTTGNCGPPSVYVPSG